MGWKNNNKIGTAHNTPTVNIGSIVQDKICLDEYQNALNAELFELSESGSTKGTWEGISIFD